MFSDLSSIKYLAGFQIHPETCRTPLSFVNESSIIVKMKQNLLRRIDRSYLVRLGLINFNKPLPIAFEWAFVPIGLQDHVLDLIHF